MTLDKYLQTIKNCILIDGFGNIKFSRFICLVAFLFFYQYCLADDIRTETVGDRVVTEYHVSKYDLYYYTINVYNEKARNIKNTKKAYDEVGLATTPAWTNDPLRRQEAKNLAQYCKDLFTNNKRRLSVKDMGIFVRTIIIDDGHVICTRIKSNVSLLNIFTTKELSDMFDKISSFRYSTPLVLSPKEGYYEADMCIWR